MLIDKSILNKVLEVLESCVLPCYTLTKTSSVVFTKGFISIF